MQPLKPVGVLSNDRPPAIHARILGTLNLMLGVMAAFSSLLSLLVVAVQATAHPHRLISYAGLLAAAAVCGMISGWKLNRNDPAANCTLAFGLLLVVFAAADMILEHTVSGRLTLLLVYGVINCMAAVTVKLSYFRVGQPYAQSHRPESSRIPQQTGSDEGQPFVAR